MSRIKVCPLAQLGWGEVCRINSQPAIAVFNVLGTLYAVADRCTHAEASLAEGYLDEENCSVECPLHGANFDLRSGAALSLPATEPLATYKLEITDGDVYVEVQEVPCSKH